MLKRALILAFGLMTTSVLAQVGNPRYGQKSRQLIAEAWAPSLYHDQAPEFHQKATGFNPVDSLLAFDFDGNQNFEDNGQNVFRLSEAKSLQALLKIPVYFSVIESKSHYYLNYILYHAIDLNRSGHVHDTENIWMVVRKDGTRYGHLEATVLNSHGFPMIYSLNQKRELAWRKKVEPDFQMDFLYLLDRYAKEHHETGRLEFIPRQRSQSPKIFIASKTHALYKLNQAKWQEGHGWGSIYLPETCSSCFDDVRSRIKETSTVRFYQLQEFEPIYFQTLAERGGRNFVYRGSHTPILNSLYRERDLPGFLVQGPQELAPKVNLFFRAQLRTPYPLSLPVEVHRFFEPKAVISTQYLYNPYVQKISPFRMSFGSIWRRIFHSED